MPPSKIRFVTACQQVLALGAVLAVLTPAASVISLDVVHDRPQEGFVAPEAAVELRAYTAEARRASRVPARAVDPKVTEYALTSTAGSRARARTKAGMLAAERADHRAVTSVPEPVVGYGAVGVTWERGARVDEDEVSLQVRTRTGADWSSWMDLQYDAEHGPDPDSAEGRRARPGTDALLVGDVDDVQVRVRTESRDLPPGLRLAVVDPGRTARTAVERPALDTASGGAPGGDRRVGAAARAAYTRSPQIYSRAQWGADESMREKSSLHYFEVHAGFVHHTVNANDYSRDEVPGIIRSIYAYHTQSRGWSDIGYNFLVDRFGRIWEGRYGGVDRPVVGAHTLHYNDYSFAMSAIGNYETARPSNAMVEAYGALFAWKLSLHGVDASSSRQVVGSRTFPAINGHRDAGATACPGKYLYARLPDIRRIAAEAQRGWAGRELESDLAATPHPDLVARRAADGRVFVLPTGGLTRFRKPVAAATGIKARQRTVVSPDLTRDGVADLVVQRRSGVAVVRPGTDAGTFAAPEGRAIRRLAGRDLVTPAGDLNGDGRNDLVARATRTGRVDTLLGVRHGRFVVRKTKVDGSRFNLMTGIGDVTDDGRRDLLARNRAGRLWLLPGAAHGRFGTPVKLAGAWQRYASISGLGDFTGDGADDLFVRLKRNGVGRVLPGRGDGTFGHAHGPLRVFARSGRVIGVAQLVRNGRPDVVVRSRGSIRVIGNAGGTEMLAPIDTGLVLDDADALLNAGDWDRDGVGDLVSRTTGGVLELRRGDGAGHFGAPIVLGTGFGSVSLLAAVGDMTGDGWPDLMGQPAGGAIRIYPGNGVDGLRAGYVAHSAIDATAQVAVGRWNGDGAPDSLFRSGKRTLLYPGNGPGGLTRGRSVGVDLTPYDWVIGISDIGLRGHADLVVRRESSGALYLIRATRKGFAKPRYLAQGMGGYDLAG
ncbi:FG-GAP-like repeat-containing protein [Nocardioides sp. YIM 152315]|uniref:FG-GAP-like repeat-containing protein n=1 Tax=Nocardioides sp. YIM 152315 TaxID=3031760 RepID=UPI0023DA5ED0|nr:FG-GAP-like repeat-containing protein [Nocardioides sp. YIM 152315]MDF1606361.1 N-acetylmuramoyl-L-alanine amidase [Nocardioides sp. YIM 152315]